MKKIDCKNMKEIKLTIYTTIAIFLFMVIVPIISINSKQKLKLDEYLDKSKVDDTMDTKDTNLVSEIKVDGDNKVSVYITSEGKIKDVDIEEYVCGVVANEMPASFSEEALKAQAIASRTYMIGKKINKCTISKGADICDSTHCQVYSSKEECLEKWGKVNSEEYWNKIEEAVESTKGMVLTYGGELVLYPLFFSTSSGKTESSKDLSWGDIPYLKSVESLGEEIAPKFTSKKEVTIGEFINTINEKYPDSGVNASNLNKSIDVLARSDAGGVINLELGNKVIKGSDFRFLVGLNSTNFTYKINDKTIVFNCKGYGHGVGMSQWGANVMAKSGSNYEEILKHYYTGVEIGKVKFKN